MSHNTLAFEDLFEIYTPSGVEREVKSLYAAWDALYNAANKQDPYITSEYRAYKIWSRSVLDSYLSRAFASGTLQELEGWKKRYQTAADYLKKKLGIKNLPAPFIIGDDEVWYKNPFIIAGVAGAAVLSFMAIIKGLMK